MDTPTPTQGHVSTGVRLPREALAVLRRAALDRAEREGGRVSVSAVLGELVLRNRDKLAGAAE